jgi:hypothetical protein
MKSWQDLGPPQGIIGLVSESFSLIGTIRMEVMVVVRAVVGVEVMVDELMARTLKNFVELLDVEVGSNTM